MVQIIIIAVYFALTVAIGLWSMRKSKSADSFHGTELGVIAIVCASAGEWLGGTSTTGVSEYGFNFGLSGSWYTIANGVGVMFLAICFAKLYRSLDSVTVPGIIEHFFGVKARSVSSVILTIVMLAVGLSQMIAAGKLGQSLLGFDFNWTVVGFAILFIIYTLAGGMNAVASTNQLHLFVMYGGVILAIIFALMKVDGWGNFTDGITAVAATEGKESYFSMFAIGMPRVSSWILASLLGACTAQAGIQPVLAAKDVPTAKQSCIVTALVVAPFGIFTAILGMVAKVMSSHGDLLDVAGANVTDAKLALPTLMMNLPPIVGGLVLASILAAILSTVSPIILAAGTMITKDLYQRVLRPSATDAQVLFMSRLTTAISGVICTVAAIAFVNMTAVLDIVYSAYSLRGALFIVVLLGIYWRRSSEKGACWSMVLTAIVAVAWVAIKMASGHYPISDVLTETYAAVIVAFIATILFSLIFPKKSSEQDSNDRIKEAK
ncbi:MAG: sodium:solute symporter family protein [Clostridiales Family XIII bacterium]|jgi:SSS family solute:Na+ symporter|nr:sodium:solute symporter family protein [Clostridiales Family XIII bacterium]